MVAVPVPFLVEFTIYIIEDAGIRQDVRVGKNYPENVKSIL